MFYQIKCCRICALIWKEIWQLHESRLGIMIVHANFCHQHYQMGKNYISISDARLCKSLTGHDANSFSTRKRNARAEKSVICDSGEKSLILFSGINDRCLLKLV